MHRLFALTAAAFLAGTAIFSAGTAEAASRRISYADLDLGTAHGRSVLDARIRAAASQLCLRDNHDLGQAAACSRDSVAEAQTELQRKLAAETVRLAAR